MAKTFNAIKIASRMKSIIEMYDEVYNKLQELEAEVNSFTDYVNGTVYDRLAETLDDLDMSEVSSNVENVIDTLDDRISDVLNNRIEYFDALKDAIFSNVEMILEKIVSIGGAKGEEFVDEHPEFSYYEDDKIKDYLKSFDVEQLLSNYCNYGGDGTCRMVADVMNDYCASKGIKSYVAVQDVEDARTTKGHVYKHILTFNAGDDAMTITVER